MWNCVAVTLFSLGNNHCTLYIAHCTLHISLGEVLVKVGIDEAADPIGDKDDKGDQTDKQDNR